MPPSRSKYKFSILEKHKYINLTTFRKSGEAVTTPIWFALDGSKLYAWTSIESGKAKRIRNNKRVRVQPSTARGKGLGDTLDGTAFFLSEGKAAAAQRAMDNKYGLMKKIFAFFGKLQKRQNVYLEILP
jgi:uncharacterized protein